MLASSPLISDETVGFLDAVWNVRVISAKEYSRSKQITMDTRIGSLCIHNASSRGYSPSSQIDASFRAPSFWLLCRYWLAAFQSGSSLSASSLESPIGEGKPMSFRKVKQLLRLKDGLDSPVFLFDLDAPILIFVWLDCALCDLQLIDFMDTYPNRPSNIRSDFSHFLILNKYTYYNKYVSIANNLRNDIPWTGLECEVHITSEKVVKRIGMFLQRN